MNIEEIIEIIRFYGDQAHENYMDIDPGDVWYEGYWAGKDEACEDLIKLITKDSSE